MTVSPSADALPTTMGKDRTANVALVCLSKVLLVMVLAGCSLLLLQYEAVHGQTGRGGLIIEVEGAIGPATADYVSRGLTIARERARALVILRLDTPGGLDSSMRVIVRAILAAQIPVIGYVAPSGARAASAGTYILYATHIAAMAPGTNIGAATPVQIGGSLPKLPSNGDKDDRENDTQPTVADKAVSDAEAYLRSLAQLRGRNAEWAEKAVGESASLSAVEALSENVIEIVASNEADLLGQLNGRVVDLPAGRLKLQTEGMVLERLAPDWRTTFLSIITNPNVAYILFLIGIYGIVLEFYNPGIFIAGIAGTICLLLALYAFQLLPISYAGLALIFLGILLMVAEAFSPSFGVLGLGGGAAFVLGSIMLLDSGSPGLEVSPVLIGSIAAVSAGLFLFVITMLMRSRRRAVVTGREEMIGSPAVIIAWKGKNGRVRVHGEIWNARSEQALSVGQSVRISEIDGLNLTVQPNGRSTPHD